MVQLYAFRRSLRLVALALSLAAFAASPLRRSPRRTARSRHHDHRHHQPSCRALRACGVYADRNHRFARRSRYGAAAVPARSRGIGGLRRARRGADARRGLPAARRTIGSSDIVRRSAAVTGRKLPPARGSLWCARFMNMVWQHSGHRGTGSDMARSFAQLRPARLRPAGRRHRRDGRGAAAAMSASSAASTPGQSDRDLRQQRQRRPGSADLARPDLRLRHADELIAVSRRPHREPRAFRCMIAR